MKKRNTLTNILFWICNISFYLLLVLFAFVLTFEILGNNIKIGDSTLGSHNSFMYQVPVKFQIIPEKPLYNNKLYKIEEEGLDLGGRKFTSGSTKFVKPITSDDSLNFKTLVSIDSYDMTNNYEFISSNFIGDGFVNVKPKTFLNKLIIVFRTYLSFIVLILVFFLLKRIFKSLKSNLEFSQKLYTLIRILGVLLIFKVLLVTISNYILGSALSYASIEPIDYSLKYVTINMNPRLDFDFSLLLVGLSLIVLSSLLRSGSKMQRENDLTI